MTAPPRLVHRERRFPSCNLTLVRGGDAVLLVDTGYGSDAAQTLALLDEEDIDPASLVIFNTHWHSDHVGGNAALRARFGTRVLAGALEGGLVNDRHPDACAADYLDQPVEAYRVDELLEDGDVIDLGGVRLTVVATPGHSMGHCSLFDERAGILVAGDALMARDVGWINPFLDGADALEAAISSLERLRPLEAVGAMSGHGPRVDDVRGAIDRSTLRLRRWREDRADMTWHGARRVFAYALMIHGGLHRDELWPYLAARRWVHDFAGALSLDRERFAHLLVDRMLEQGAGWSPAERLVATLPHSRPGDGRIAAGYPSQWP